MTRQANWVRGRRPSIADAVRDLVRSLHKQRRQESQLLVPADEQRGCHRERAMAPRDQPPHAAARPSA